MGYLIHFNRFTFVESGCPSFVCQFAIILRKVKFVQYIPGYVSRSLPDRELVFEFVDRLEWCEKLPLGECFRCGLRLRVDKLA